MTAIERVIGIVGSAAELARCCGVRSQAVQQWKYSGRIPAERVLVIEKAVGGIVTRYDMRPDVFGDSAEASNAVHKLERESTAVLTPMNTLRQVGS